MSLKPDQHPEDANAVTVEFYGPHHLVVAAAVRDVMRAAKWEVTELGSLLVINPKSKEQSAASFLEVYRS